MSKEIKTDCCKEMENKAQEAMRGGGGGVGSKHYLDGKTKWFIVAEGYCVFEIKYCPFCGTELEDK